MGNGTRPTYHCVHGRPASPTHPRYISVCFFSARSRSGVAREVSREHEGELMDGERADAAKRGLEGHVTRDKRRAGINVDGDVDRR